jgi:hypothetical protein
MMSALANVETYMPSLRPLHGAIRNIEGRADELIELDAHELWRLQGDNRWRMIVCVSGEVWVTQKCDLRDYVLEPGEILVVTQRGDVLVEALSTASVVVTPSLKGAPYKGPYLVFA